MSKSTRLVPVAIMGSFGSAQARRRAQAQGGLLRFLMAGDEGAAERALREVLVLDDKLMPRDNLRVAV